MQRSCRPMPSICAAARSTAARSKSGCCLHGDHMKSFPKCCQRGLKRIHCPPSVGFGKVTPNSKWSPNPTLTPEAAAYPGCSQAQGAASMKVQLALSVALPQRAAQTFTCQFGNLELPKLKSATCLCCGSRSHTNPKLVPGVIATSQCFDRLELPKPQSLDSVIPMLLCTGLVFSVMICSRLDVLVINRLILFLQHEDPVEGGGV